MRTRIPPLAQLILSGLVGWLVAKGLSEYTFVSVAIRSVGWALIALGSFVLLLSVRTFVREKTTVNPLSPDQVNTLVTTGLYRYSRNPMYVGMALLLAGFALLLQNLAAFLIGLTH
jgi:protein-S-isoprenylcysteine O-methyltransferase Ste14